MERPVWQYVGCGALFVAAGVACAGALLVVGDPRGWVRDDVLVTVEIPDAVGLVVDGGVAVAGVKVGTLKSLEVRHDRALATLALYEAAGLRRDVAVRIRSKSVLGEKYVELSPNSVDAPLLSDGDALQLAPEQSEIDEVVDQLGPLLAAIDPKALQQNMGGLADALREDPERLARMLRNADHLLQNGADASDELSATLREGRATLARANRALEAVEARANEAQVVIAHADRVLGQVEAVTEPLPSTVAKADAALDELRAAIEPMAGATQDVGAILANFQDFDREAIRELLRDDGVRVHLFGRGRSVAPRPRAGHDQSSEP